MTGCSSLSQEILFVIEVSTRKFLKFIISGTGQIFVLKAVIATVFKSGTMILQSLLYTC